MNPTDPRLGLPSASSALEDGLCSGRHRAQMEWKLSGAAEPPDETGESHGGYDMDRDAEAGKRIHLLYAGKECPEATQAERDRAAAGREVDQLMYGKWLDIVGHGSTVVEVRERRFWFNHPDGSPRYSGQADAVWLAGSQGHPVDILVGDLKGLFGYHDQASINGQIRRYIALIAVSIQEMGYPEVRSAMAYLNQPAKTMNPKPVMYQRDDIEQAMFEMEMDLLAMENPEAVRTPGPRQCSKCLAKMMCEPYLLHVCQLPVPIPSDTMPTKEELAEKVKSLSGHHLAQLLPWVASLSHLSDMATAEAKRRLSKDPESVPGYQLHKNPPRRKITEIRKLYQILMKEYGVTGEEFSDLCVIANVRVEEILRAKTGAKGKGLEEKVNSILKLVTMPVPVAASLEKKT